MLVLKKSKLSLYLIVLVLSVAFLSGCGKEEADKASDDNQVTIAGSTSVTPYAEKIAREFQNHNKNVMINVQGLGSTAGIKAADENTADIGMASRDLKDEEKNLGIDEHIIAHEGIAVITNPNNKVKNLDIDTMTKIFKGDIKNWKDVGGKDQAIIIISREAGSGTRAAFDELAKLEEEKGDKKLSILSEDALIADGNGAIKQNIASKENAIGYISLGYVDESINALSIDGVEPTVENVISKTYRISRPFLFLTKGDLKEETRDYLDFVMSDEGQAIMEAEGAVPIK